MPRKFLLSLGLALGLAACTGATSGTTVTSDDVAPKKGTEQKKPEDKVAIVQPSPQEPVVVPEKPRVLLEPTVLIGKTPVEIEAALGKPKLRRKDAPAEVWQYLAAGCALHLFFYPDTSGKGLIIRHIAINGRSVESFSDLDRKQCFNDHLKAVGAEEAFISKGAS